MKEIDSAHKQIETLSSYFLIFKLNLISIEKLLINCEISVNIIYLETFKIFQSYEF